jgi:hypothetical protein
LNHTGSDNTAVGYEAGFPALESLPTCCATGSDNIEEIDALVHRGG